jgi:hypothetical protein
MMGVALSLAILIVVVVDVAIVAVCCRDDAYFHCKMA